MHAPDTGLTDELLSCLVINRATTWTPGGLGLDEAAFAGVVQRLLELEALGRADIFSMQRAGPFDGRRPSAIRFALLDAVQPAARMTAPARQDIAD